MDCFKDVEWSMGESGPRQGQGRVQGWQGGHSRRQTTSSQIAVAVSRGLRCPCLCTPMIYQQQQQQQQYCKDRISRLSCPARYAYSLGPLADRSKNGTGQVTTS
jgi:hypothetical protein